MFFYTSKLFTRSFYQHLKKMGPAGRRIYLRHFFKIRVKLEFIYAFKRLTICLFKGHNYEERADWGRLDVCCIVCTLKHRNHYNTKTYPLTNGYEIPIEEWKARFPTVYK